MTLWIPLPGFVMIILALAVIAWCATRRPFRLALAWLMAKPARWVVLAPGIVGVGVWYLLFSYATVSGRLGYVVQPLLWIVVAVVQLAGLAGLLAREHGKPAGKDLLLSILPIVLVSVLVPAGRSGILGLLTWAFDRHWTISWIPVVVEFGIDVVLILVGWFVVRWAVNLFIRAVLDVRHPDAQYEVDAQFTAAGQDPSVWPLAIFLGLLTVQSGSIAAYELAADFPAVLAPMNSPWMDELRRATIGGFVWTWLLASMVSACVVSIMLVGFVLAFVDFRKTLAPPVAAAAAA